MPSGSAVLPVAGSSASHCAAPAQPSTPVIWRVMSAVANAENNHGLDVNELVVSEAYVGKNLVLRRFHARGRGRSGKILKPFSQITVIVKQQAQEAAEAKETE